MKPGIFKNIAFADYIADKSGECPTLNASVAHLLLSQSPQHGWFAHPRLNPAPVADESEVADIGSIAHHILLAGDTRDIVVIDAKDYRTNAAKEARDQARANGGIPVLQHKLAAISDMVLAARAYLDTSELAGILQDGAPEQTMVWQEMFIARGGEQRGRQVENVWCRARPDWLTANGKIMLHFKTTSGSAEPASWIRNHLANDGNDLTAAFYERGLSNILSVHDARSVFLVQENYPPYACSLVGLDPAFLDMAHRKANTAINIWADCVTRNEWPSYPSRIAWAEPAPWQASQWENREMNAAYDQLQAKEGLQP